MTALVALLSDLPNGARFSLGDELPRHVAGFALTTHASLFFGLVATKGEIHVRRLSDFASSIDDRAEADGLSLPFGTESRACEQSLGVPVALRRLQRVYFLAAVARRWAECR